MGKIHLLLVVATAGCIHDPLVTLSSFMMSPCLLIYHINPEYWDRQPLQTV